MEQNNVRLRSRGSFYPGPQVVGFGWNTPVCGTDTYTEVSTSNSCLVGEVATMGDVVVKNFQSRSKRGEMFFNPLNQEVRTSSIDTVGHGHEWRQLFSPGCVIDLKPYFPGVKYDGPALALAVANVSGGSGSALPSPSAIIDNDEVVDLQTEISTSVLASRALGSTNLFESIGEYKQTIALFSGPIKGFFRFFRKNGPKMRLMTPQEAWLTYRYGIKPLISDLETIINGLKKEVGLRRETTRKRQEIRRTSTTTLNSGIDDKASYTIHQLTTDTVTVRGMAIDEFIATLGSNLGFTVKGFATVPWELMRFSFVLDWFVSAGDFLKAYAPSPGYKTVGSCLVTERTISNLWSCISTAQAGFNAIVRSADGACSSTIRTKTRGSLSKPGLVIRNDFRFASLIRTADALALIAVLMTSYFADGDVSSGLKSARAFRR